MLSCQGPPEGEWRLHPEVVEIIWERFSPAELDIFTMETLTPCHFRFSLWGRTPWLTFFANLPTVCLSPNSANPGDTGENLSWRSQTDRQTVCCSLLARHLLSQLEGSVWHSNADCLQLCVWQLEAGAGTCPEILVLLVSDANCFKFRGSFHKVTLW